MPLLMVQFDTSVDYWRNAVQSIVSNSGHKLTADSEPPRWSWADSYRTMCLHWCWLNFFLSSYIFHHSGALW